MYSFYEVSTANMNATNNMLTITGGQGSYPLAYIETDRALEFTFASSEFTPEMFGMANGVPLESGDTSTLESKLFSVSSELAVTIPYEVKAGSVRIRGFKEVAAEPAAKGEFMMEVDDATHTTELTFFAGDVKAGETIRVAYRRRVNGAQTANVLVNSRTAKGSLAAHWPVYSSGTNADESALKGYLHLEIPRVRVTTLPGFDVSYKSAATQSVTFSAIDPKGAGDKMYALIYEPLDIDGKVITTPTSGQAEW